MMEQVTFKSVAGMYIGCPMIRVSDMERVELSLVSYFAAVNIGSCKPILRRIEDMTEKEELKALVARKYGDDRCEIYRDSRGVEFVVYGTNGQHLEEGYINADALNPQQFRYLLSIHIDLFGLIESGEAIDAKNVKG